jgi:hypothetical protein
MAKRYHFRTAAKDAIGIAFKLLSHRPTRTDKLPKTGGVYLIRHNRDGIIYVGISNNLKRRVHGQHNSSSSDLGSSSFRRSVAARYHKKPGKELSDWMDKHCVFSFAAIPDQNMVRLVEQVLIVTLKRAGEPLLNKK